MRTRVLSLALVSLLSCSSDPEGTVQLTVGEEADALTRTPAPTTLVVQRLAQDGTAQEIARSALPAATLDLGHRDPGEISALSTRALDASGATLLRGETLFLQFGALDGVSLPAFIQRTGELARMPGAFPSNAASKAIMVLGRYVLFASGTTGQLYDLLSLAPVSTSPTLPRNAKSITAVGSAVLAIDENGASTIDLTTNETTEIPAPANGTYAEIAGGDRYGASDTSQYIVGATRREGDPTARLLYIDASSAASFQSLTAPRLGACATYVNGRGLFVYGGSATAAGAEILAPGSSVATPLPLAPDPVIGCDATTLDATHVLVVGGTGADTGSVPARVIDLTCTTNCAPVAWPDPVPLLAAQVLPITTDAVFVLGTDATGASHAYRTSANAGTREIPLRTPRQGARLVYSPTGAFLVLGGNAGGIEQYLE